MEQPRRKVIQERRASGKDENMILTPPMRLSLEQALSYITDDELVEITPKAVRMRKIYLKEGDCKRQARNQT